MRLNFNHNANVKESLMFSEISSHKRIQSPMLALNESFGPEISDSNASANIDGDYVASLSNCKSSFNILLICVLIILCSMHQVHETNG